MGNPIESLAALLASLKQWAARPFSQDMGIGHWFLFTGLVLVMVVLWNMVLRDLKGE
ncbi:MAG TPA: hypothetical protein PLK61_04065 [Nitrosomonas sp.]|nr:hypothetical protein [Nitrosomonas sp.]